jgi:serine protease Do
MIKIALIAATAIIGLSSFTYFNSAPKSPDYDQMMASVVKIEALNDKNNEIGHGSGVFIENGLILSVNHVFAGENGAKSPKFIAKTEDGTILDLKIVKLIPEKDMAFLEPVNNKTNLQKSKLSCKPVKLGQDIISMGNPTILEFITTFGKVAGHKVSSEFTSYDIIPTDLTVAPGMSGGPVFNVDGEVIGLNDAILNGPAGYALAPNDPDDPSKGVEPRQMSSYTGISMLIPGDDICEEMAKLDIS